MKARQVLNEQLAARALRRGAGIAVHRPVIVFLQIASTCNLDCYMCSEHNSVGSSPNGRGLRSLDPEIFSRIEEEVFPWSSRTSLGIGGEPTISEHFVDYVRRADRAGQSIQLTSNGTRFHHRETAEMTVRHVRRLQVSIDAATAPTYERIRRGGSWDRLRRGLEQLNELRDASPAEPRCHLTLCFTLMRSNVDELPAFVELAAGLNADVVHAQHVIPVTEEGRAESLIGEPGHYDRKREEALERARSLGLSFDAPQAYGGDNGSPAEPPGATADAELEASSNPLADYVVPCYHPNQSIYVMHDGRVFSCCHPFAHRKMLIGDLREQSFASLWNGRLLRNLRTGLHRGDVPTICHSCSVAHDPPILPEDSTDQRNAPDLAEHYGERDLDPLGEDPLWPLERTGSLDHLDALCSHVQALEAERSPLLEHARALEEERPQLLQHIANLEPERERLLAHVANLEYQRHGLPLARHVLSTVFGARFTRQLDRLRGAAHPEPPTEDQR